MKRKLQIATLMLGLSTVAGSAYAASNSDMWETTKSSEPVNLEEMAKEKGITLDELITQLEKEGTITTAASLTDSVNTEGATESNMSGSISVPTNSTESVSLEEMAKEKGITVDELIAQLEEEGKLIEALELTESTPVENGNK
ncbi:hypothetical protein [Solibacillus sp. CAU 1738]|uniref:hypothetical protein n=1 Tax=Solibacillus sp. CAU 1738 TaxID=3140363 RepID=UPI0032604059